MFRCERCGGEFGSQEQLDAHARDEHGATNRGGHICAACGMGFDSREELELHAKADHAA
jgi:uncharacterized C2H2 Zn-finger protein